MLKGHRGAAARVPDDEDRRRARGAERQGLGRADGAGRRVADRRVHGQSPTGSTASSSMRRRASGRPRRRSTRSTCSPTRRRASRSPSPGRDTSASAIEEVFVEAQAEDDFGVRDLELVYSVNGGPEKTVKLFGGRNRLPEVTAGHTFYLEELGVEPGDAVSYYARALDNSGGQNQSASSDLYFLRVRPFNKDFRQAQSGPAAAAAVAAAAAARWRRCRSSSARSSRRRSTCSAIAGRTRRRSCARAPRSSACRSRGCASRSKGCSRA